MNQTYICAIVSKIQLGYLYYYNVSILEYVFPVGASIRLLVRLLYLYQLFPKVWYDFQNIEANMISTEVIKSSKYLSITSHLIATLTRIKKCMVIIIIYVCEAKQLQQRYGIRRDRTELSSCLILMADPVQSVYIIRKGTDEDRIKET